MQHWKKNENTMKLKTTAPQWETIFKKKLRMNEQKIREKINGLKNAIHIEFNDSFART